MPRRKKTFISNSNLQNEKLRPRRINYYRRPYNCFLILDEMMDAKTYEDADDLYDMGIQNLANELGIVKDCAMVIIYLRERIAWTPALELALIETSRSNIANFNWSSVPRGDVIDELDRHNIYSPYRLIDFCCKGELNDAEKLCKKHDINIKIKNEAFIQTCYIKNLVAVRWLLSIHKFDNDLVDTNLPEELYEYSFYLGYMGAVKMNPAYVAFRNKIRSAIITVFEMIDIVNMIMMYI